MSNAGPAGSDPGAGEIAGSITAVILRCVERAAGDRGIERMMELAGDDRPPEILRKSATWTPYDTTVRLFRAGIDVTGNPQFARLVGEEMLRQYDGSEVAALLRSLGSPGEVLRNVAVTATKFSTATRLDAVSIEDDHAVVEAWAIEGLERDETFCDYTAGILSQTSVLFGMDSAEVVETRCQRRGDARCCYEVRWLAETSPDADVERRIAHLEAQLARITERFEAMQLTTRELVSTGGVEEVLEAIAKRAAMAVQATRHLLAVSLGSDDVRVHAQGFANEEEARRIADELLTEDPDDRDGSRLIVDIVSGDRRFGRLAALYPQGAQFFPAERRILEAYAATAGAALNVATALEEAQRQNQTARTLLSLASALAEARTVDAVAEQLAKAVPAVVDCDRATVMVWDSEMAVLRYRGVTGVDSVTEKYMRAAVIRADGMPELADMLATPGPRVIDADNASPLLRATMEGARVQRVCFVPLMARGQFCGVVTAPISTEREFSQDQWERLQGLADQGATALQNAQLVEHIHYQALHDGLTGTPNRVLLDDRLRTALAQARRDGKQVALLFLDLDRFKDVNDTYGHVSGDELLKEVARRLQASVRATDTVARMGGDEFVILLTECEGLTDARRVAEKVLDVMREPFDLGTTHIHVSASVGVAVAHANDDVEAVLSHADRAMYRAKSSGRNRVELAA
jgi:diguanylate cyclase (GGDEF)-like protein